jgi:hypothetical protein
LSASSWRTFEVIALEAATLKPLCWFHYMDDMFIMSPHSPGKLIDFHDQVNSVHENVQFTVMEVKGDSYLPFLDIDIRHKTNHSLSYRIYYTHTSECQLSPPHHHCHWHQHHHHHPHSITATITITPTATITTTTPTPSLPPSPSSFQHTGCTYHLGAQGQSTVWP